ncbi:unnamed protein product [Mytilus coruscus]|uniref:Uncharacterized protein n=1 Tax=Mytilus coruscus TaxID=42192 RepID=A0A6J8CS69_MYTCO|nr:unnamed protein product [Mytilus coruscus]
MSDIKIVYLCSVNLTSSGIIQKKKNLSENEPKSHDPKDTMYVYMTILGTNPTSLTIPSFESPWYKIEAQNTAHKNLIIRHNLGEYPLLVDVQVKIQKNGKVFIFTDIGSAHRDDDTNNPYGGTVYIYNKINIFLTFPLKNNDFETGGLAYTGIIE